MQPERDGVVLPSVDPVPRPHQGELEGPLDGGGGGDAWHLEEEGGPEESLSPSWVGGEYAGNVATDT